MTKRSKSSRKNKSNFPLSTAVIAYGFFSFLAILVLFVVAIYQDRQIQSLAKEDFNQSASAALAEQYRSLSVDATGNRAYASDARVGFVNTNNTSTVLYRHDANTASSTKDVILMVSNRDLVGNLQFGADGTCYNPYIVTIESDPYQGYEKVATKQLQDGRDVVIYESTAKDCAYFVDGTTGKAIMTMLRSVQSY